MRELLPGGDDSLDRVDRLCDAFEDAWQAGQQPRIEDYLGDASGEERDQLLRWLILLEIDYRRQRGETPWTADYHPRFRELDATWLAGLMATERAGSDPGATLNGGTTAVIVPELCGRCIGDYELESEIARGGMGVVYRARQRSLKNRTVAVKMILAGQLASAAEVQRFLGEAENAASLDHPNIVPIYEVDSHDGQPYFSMKYIEGGHLGQRLQEFTGDPKAAARLMATVARAVHYAHQRGILHRDLKPANILLDGEGKPHVTDFGLAKRVQGDAVQTQTGAIIGTPGYMSPEQARAEKSLTTAADVYALGAILYELLAGRPPFKAETPLETLAQVVRDDPIPPRRLCATTPRDLEIICLTCLRKEPGKRYSSAEKLAEDLEHFLADEPIQARDASAWERGWRWCRRKPLVVGLVAVSVLAGLALVGVAVGGVYNAQLGEVNSRLEGAIREVHQQRADLADVNSRLTDALQTTETQKAEVERQRTLVEHYLYGVRVNQADRALQEGRVESALQLLQTARLTPSTGQHRPGFEWNYLLRRCRVELLPTPLNGRVMQVVCSGDGKKIAAASDAGMVKVWDASSGRELLTLSDISYPGSVAFSPDSRYLAAPTADNKVRIWAANSGEEVLALEGDGRPMHGVAFTRDGRRLASSVWTMNQHGSIPANQPGGIQVWDARTGRRLLSVSTPPGIIWALEFSPDGKLLAGAGSDKVIRLWDTCTGQVRELTGHKQAVLCLAFSPDGKRLVSGSGYSRLLRYPNPLPNKPPPGEVCMWEVANGEVIFTEKEKQGSVLAVRFTPDGRWVASAGAESSVTIRRATWGAEADDVGWQVHHAGEISGLAFSPDGSRLITGGWDQAVRVWGLVRDEGGLRILEKGKGEAEHIAFSPNGKYLAVKKNQFEGIHLYEADTGKLVRRFPVMGRARFAFSPDGQRLTAADRVWEVATGREVAVFKGSLSKSHGAGFDVAFSPDGKRLAATTGAKSVIVWDAQTGEPIFTLKGHANYVYTVAFSPDGSHLASAGEEGVVKVWDAVTGQDIRTLRGCVDPIYKVAYSPDGKQLAAASGTWHSIRNPGEVKIWDPDSGRELFTLRGHSEAVWGLAYSPDGSRLASSSGVHMGPEAKQPGEVKLWNTVNGQELLTLRGAAGRILGVAFSPDGTRLAAACRGFPPGPPGGGIVLIWDAHAPSGPNRP